MLKSQILDLSESLPLRYKKLQDENENYKSPIIPKYTLSDCGPKSRKTVKYMFIDYSKFVSSFAV